MLKVETINKQHIFWLEKPKRIFIRSTKVKPEKLSGKKKWSYDPKEFYDKLAQKKI